MRKILYFLVLVMLFMVLATGCSTENIKQVNIYEMENFLDVKENSLVKIKDSKEIETFIRAFNRAKKLPGIVDMVYPEYKVTLGDEKYLLWINEDSGTIMNVKDTHAAHKITESLAKEVRGIIRKYYPSN